MPRPGFVLDVDRSTPPILVHHGESLRLEKLPAGRSRVLYPGEPLEPLDDPEGAIRHALANPLGDSEPLRALLRPGMKLTIAFDDISLPLPPMRRPDVRQRIIEAVLDVAAEVGVDDVHLIAALALHRRMTEAELRHAVGDRVYDAFAPQGLLYNHDAEDPDNLTLIGTTPHGEEVEINKRAADSDLIIYVNINIVSMDGGHKSTATGLSSYRSLRHHHNVQTMRHSTSFMDRHASELHSSNWRMGKVIRDAGVKIFQIETTI
ncbi:MAG: lactate racemase domain-containing protein, partial [Acidimicrobiales bacterium]|nr:lactate racemase domain-containing protein [Acidimicrobiales bacterium]